MSWDPATLHTIWTVIAFIAFISITVWAWSSKRRKHFDRAAHIPFDDEQ